MARRQLANATTSAERIQDEAMAIPPIATAARLVQHCENLGRIALATINTDELEGLISGTTGDDTFVLNRQHEGLAIDMAGHDRITFGSRYLYRGLTSLNPITVTNFTAGSDGDVLDIGAALSPLTHWDQTANAFASGHLRLSSVGSDVLVQIDYDGEGGESVTYPLVLLKNVALSGLTAANFAGYSPDGLTIATLVITGSAGDDVLEGWASADILSGGDGSDTIVGGLGNDILDGGAGADRIEGGHGNDRIIGGPGDDTLSDTADGGDFIDGGDGNDTITISRETTLPSGNGTILGGAGDDEVVFAAIDTWTIDLGAGNDHLLMRTLPIGTSTVTLGAGTDTITFPGQLASQANGTVVITDFVAGSGGDVLDITAFNHWLSGALTDSQTYAGWNEHLFNRFASGELRLVQSGADTLLQSSPFAHDTNPDNFRTLVILKNVVATDLIAYNFGGVEPYHQTVSLTAGQDIFNGTAGADVAFGLDSNDNLFGLEGDDLLDGGRGADSLVGGAGNDLLRGGPGNDNLDGGEGDDIIQATADPSRGGDGADKVSGGNGRDVIEVDYSDQVNAGAGDDVISVRSDYLTNEAFVAGAVPGFVNAGDGNDVVITQADIIVEDLNGPYTVNLGAGNDLLIFTGGFGTVTLGSGVDTLRAQASSRWLASPDVLVVTDFKTGAGGDVVDLSYVNVFGWNPFLMGELTLVQSGADVMMALGPAPGPITSAEILFKNTTLSDFTAENFAGMDPHATFEVSTSIQSTTIIANGASLVKHNPFYDVNSVAGVSYDSRTGTAQFINHGSVSIDFTAPLRQEFVAGFTISDAGTPTPQSLFLNAADGRFIVTADLAVDGFLARNQSISFQNDGLFQVSSTTDPFSIFVTRVNGVVAGYVGFFDAPIVNTGRMTIAGGSETVGVRMGSYGHFDNSGVLDVFGERLSIGVYLTDATGEQIDNQGTIRAVTTPDSPYYSIGVLVEAAVSPFNAPPLIRNSGTIDADIAVFSIDTSIAGSPMTLVNSGHIAGAVMVGDGDDTVINSGTMSSRTLLGLGNDLYDGSQGYHSGSVEGGNGSDRLIGGAGAEAMFGDSGDDVILGGAGDDYVEGGSGSDVMDGGAGEDTLSYYSSVMGVTVDMALGLATSRIEQDWFRNFENVFGSGANDTILGSARSETLEGYRGNDIINGRAGDDIIIGGTGDDELTGGSGADEFLFDAGDGHDTITDFGAADRLLVFGYSAVRSFQQIGADLKIVFSADDSVLVRNATAADFGATHLIFTADPIGLDAPAPADETIVAEADLLIEYGTMIVVGDTLANKIRVSTIQATAIALIGSTKLAGIGVYNAGTVAIHSTLDVPETYGIATSSAQAYDGRDNWVVNKSTGIVDVVAEAGNARGVSFVPSVWNAGTISARAMTGDASAVSFIGTYNVYGPRMGGLMNSGLLSATARDHAYGLYQGDSTGGQPLIFNSGTIAVHGGLTSYGINEYLSGPPLLGPPVIVNSGDIIVTDETAAADSAGLFLAPLRPGTIWNSGKISADYAIQYDVAQFSIYASYAQTVYNSGLLDGRVYMSGYDDTVINTGSITGDVQLFGGNDLFDSRRGTFTGKLDGYDGNDVLLTGAGSQTLDGGFGNDILSGGSGNDTLTGGFGNDSFRFGAGFGRDTITDFQTLTGHDTIDVSDYASFQSIVQQDGDVLITFSAADSLLVKGVSVAQLTAPGIINFGVAAIMETPIPEAPGPYEIFAESPQTSLAPTVTFAAIEGTGANDRLSGDIGPDGILGKGGNDTLTGGTGNDQLDGGTGNDVAVYTVSRTAAVVSHDAAKHQLIVADTPDGSDTTVRVEQFQFTDGLYSFGFQQTGTPVIANFAIGAGGWTSQNSFPRHLADVNGDGQMDVVGFGQPGVFVSLGGGGGTFGPLTLAATNFGAAQGWLSDAQYHRELADINGDGRSDIIGFGQAGTLVAMARADGSYAGATFAIADFGVAQGWQSQVAYARTVGDVNGDGFADLVGFGQNGTLISLGRGDGTFAAAKFALANFGVAQGWTSDTSFHRTVADVNGDGKDDVIGFGVSGVYVALSNGDGTLGEAKLAATNFGTNQGWGDNDATPRVVGDVNNDGRADIVGFGLAGTFVAFGNDDGAFTSASFDLANFAQAQGWTSDATYHRELADMDGDGLTDIVGFGYAGVLVGMNQFDYLL